MHINFKFSFPHTLSLISLFFSGGKQYELKIKKKIVCTKAFCLVYGISMDKLIASISHPTIPHQLIKSNDIEVTKDNIKERVVTFLTGIAEDDGFSEPDPVITGVRRLSSFHTKKDLWQSYCENFCETAFIPSYIYFSEIWRLEFSHLRNNLIHFIFLFFSFIFIFLNFSKLFEGSCDMIVYCDFCSTTKNKINEMKETNQKNFLVELQIKLETHLSIQKAHRQYETKIRGLAQVNKSVQSVNMDHMAKKFMVKLKNCSKQHYKVCSSLKVLLGGHYTSKNGRSKYFISSEAYGETGSTIISEIHSMMLEIIEERTTELYLIMDNHSTNKNSIVFAYIDYLVILFNFSIE